MNRDDILALVVTYMTEANEELRAADVDPARSMVDHGLMSLDIVEVVTPRDAQAERDDTAPGVAEDADH